MDKQIVEDLKQQRQDALGAVAKEMAWEEEKCRITLHKLESRSVNSLPHMCITKVVVVVVVMVVVMVMVMVMMKTFITRMTLSRAHIAANDSDVAKLLH